MRTCCCCGNEVTERNDSMSIRRMLSEEEYERFKPYEKDVCIDCKKELMLAGIVAVC